MSSEVVVNHRHQEDGVRSCTETRLVSRDVEHLEGGNGMGVGVGVRVGFFTEN